LFALERANKGERGRRFLNNHGDADAAHFDLAAAFVIILHFVCHRGPGLALEAQCF